MKLFGAIIVTGNYKLTIGLFYRSPNINEEDKTKIRKHYKGSIILRDFSHGHIQWKSLESMGGGPTLSI